jgi:hypothetical protein
LESDEALRHDGCLAPAGRNNTADIVVTVARSFSAPEVSFRRRGISVHF